MGNLNPKPLYSQAEVFAPTRPSSSVDTNPKPIYSQAEVLSSATSSYVDTKDDKFKEINDDNVSDYLVFLERQIRGIVDYVNRNDIDNIDNIDNININNIDVPNFFENNGYSTVSMDKNRFKNYYNFISEQNFEFNRKQQINKKIAKEFYLNQNYYTKQMNNIKKILNNIIINNKDKSEKEKILEELNIDYKIIVPIISKLKPYIYKLKKYIDDVKNNNNNQLQKYKDILFKDSKLKNDIQLQNYEDTIHRIQKLFDSGYYIERFEYKIKKNISAYEISETTGDSFGGKKLKSNKKKTTKKTKKHRKSQKNKQK
jgi:hypothetical protein